MKRLAVMALAITSVTAPLVISEPVAAASRADCNKYVGLFRQNHLPVNTFKAIAWRESGCNPHSFVRDSDDHGGGLLGINLKGSLGPVWKRWCGATLANITNAAVNVRCAAAAYRRMGLRPWN